jgi:hypothetical protein
MIIFTVNIFTVKRRTLLVPFRPLESLSTENP